MASPVSAVCQTTTSVPDEGYRSEDDIFRNAALVTTHLLDELEIDPFEYIEARPHTESVDWSAGVYVQAVPLVDGFEYHDQDGQEIISMRTNVLRTISESLDPGDVVDVRSAGIETSPPLRVKRSYADEHFGERCYIARGIRSQIGIEKWGDSVEIIHPETGARTILPAWPLNEWDNADSLGLDLHSRELLDVRTGNKLRVHRPVSDLSGITRISRASTLDTLKTKIFEFFIDRQMVSLGVMRGPNQDEHRNIARCTRDMMEMLGVEPGELATIQWKGRTHTVQLLTPPEDEGVPPLSMRLPSTERDQIGISIGDAAVCWRNMGYYFKKNIVTSLFGVIGVVIGIFEVVNTLSIFEQYQPAVGYLGLITILAIASVVISLIVVWIMLYPERQAVTKSGRLD